MISEEHLKRLKKATVLEALARNKWELKEDADVPEEGIRALEKDGFVFRKDGDVLRTVERADLLAPEYIALYLKNPCCLRWKRITDSTNEDAKRAAASGQVAPSVYLAEVQTAGRGRAGRCWESGCGEEVQMSFLVRPEIAPKDISGLSFAAGLGIAEGLEKLAGLEVRLKWPNDVVIGSRKICGILIETAMKGNELDYAVIGTGININQRSFPGELRDKATSLMIETGKRYDRARAAAILIESVFLYTEAFSKGGMDALMAEYCEKSAVLGREITVLTNDRPIVGICMGFGVNGEIQVRTDAGDLSFAANDVSVRAGSDYL